MDSGRFRQKIATCFSELQTGAKTEPLATLLIDWLNSFAARITTHTFVPPAPEVILMTISVILSISGLILACLKLPFIGAAAALLGFWAFFRHFMGMSTPIQWLFPHHRALNTIGHIAADKVRTEGYLVFLIHPDQSAYHPLSPPTRQKLRVFFLCFTALMILTIPWAYLGDYWGRLPLYWQGSMILTLILMISLSLYFLYFKPLRRLTGDGAGLIAVNKLLAELVKDRQRIYDIYVLCGDGRSTPVGSARAFLKRYAGILDPDNTLVINLDLRQNRQPAYLTGEGMLVHWHADEALLNKCATLSGEKRFSKIRPRANRLFQTAALPFLQQNYLCLSLVSQTQVDAADPVDRSVCFVSELIKEYFK